MYKFLTRISSETGKRVNNEDACTALKIANDTYILAVADGLGGNEGGGVASKLVISSVLEYLSNIFKNNISENDLKGILEDAFIIAQKSISDFTFNSSEYKGMGTTLTILLLHEKKYVWGNIGDSRLYLMQNDEVKQMTNDHTYIADYIKSGGEELPQTVLSHYSNIITRKVDGGIDKPDIYPSENKSKALEEEDIFLLCTDGMIVNKSVDMGDILKKFLKKKSSMREISDKLIKWALENGSNDNVSVVIGKYTMTKEIPGIEDYITLKLAPLNNSDIKVS
jgi:serine/threonine protein phosphatase PrpC